MINTRRSHISINRVSNREEFIQKAQCVHGDKYDYSLVEYISTSDKVKIRCFKHNFIFEQVPNSHLRGSNCPLCARENTTLKNRLTQDEFINRSSVVHNNKYDYSLAKYEKSNTKVEIICPKHGAFKQSPSGHLSGKGCEKCARELIRCNRMTTESFIEEANKVHNFRYNYSLVAYKKSNIKIRIICPVHGPFDQTPNNHIMGYECIKCSTERSAKKRTCTTQEFIEKATLKFGDRYDYSMVDYRGIERKVKIICKLHGPFLMTPGCHLMKKGCPICGRWSLLTTDIFKERSIKLHGNKYDYSLVNYKNIRTKVKIICPKHGVFEQMAQSHLKGSGCFLCLESQGEKKICLYLDAHQIMFERERSFEGCRDKNPLQFDFFLPDYNTCVEFDGLQHFQPVDYFGGEATFEKTKKSDAIKTDFCKKYGINLIRIPYKKISETDLILGKEIVKLSLQKVV